MAQDAAVSGRRSPATDAATPRGDPSLPAGAWQVDLLEGGPGLIDDHRHEWSNLCGRIPGNPWYCRPEWVKCYVEHFAPPSGVRLVTARRGGKLHAVLPLVAGRLRACGLPARRLRSAADNNAWRFDVARAAGEPGDAALAAIARQLPHLGAWDYLELRDVPEGGAGDALARCAADAGLPVSRVESMRSPRLRLDGWDRDPDYFLKRVSTSFRGNMRRAIRAAGGGLRIERIEAFEPEAFERFLALEACGWKGEAGSALATDPLALAYHRALFETVNRGGDFVMKFVHVDEKPVAAVCAVEHGGVHVVLKSGRDESLRKLSPGHLLVHVLLLDCAERGMKVFDFIGVDEDWKLRWAPEILPHHTHYIFRKGLYGRALHTAMFKLSPALRRLRAKG